MKLQFMVLYLIIQTFKYINDLPGDIRKLTPIIANQALENSIIGTAFETAGLLHTWASYPTIHTFLLWSFLQVGEAWYTCLYITGIVFGAINLLIVQEIGTKLYGSRATENICMGYILLSIFWDISGLDIISVLPMLAALLFLINNKSKIKRQSCCAGFMTAIGILIKVFPFSVALSTLKTEKGKTYYFTALVTTLLIISLPYFLVDPDIFLGSYLWQLQREGWNTIWVVLKPDAGFGTVLGWTPSIQEMVNKVSLSPRFDSLLLATQIGLALSLTFVILKSKIEKQEDLVRLTTAILSISLFWGSGWSPNWDSWITPLFLLSMPNVFGVAFALAFTQVAWLQVWARKLRLIVPSTQAWRVFQAVIVIRTILLLVAAILFSLSIMEHRIKTKLERVLAPSV